LKGLSSFWHHTHEFADVEGGTEMTDTVRHGIRGGIIGTAVHALFVMRQLEQIFNFREERLREIFPADKSSTSVPRKTKKRSAEK
jgi:ligand-binding SRPBCC domain-containing protein